MAKVMTAATVRAFGLPCGSVDGRMVIDMGMDATTTGIQHSAQLEPYEVVPERREAPICRSRRCRSWEARPLERASARQVTRAVLRHGSAESAAATVGRPDDVDGAAAG